MGAFYKVPKEIVYLLLDDKWLSLGPNGTSDGPFEMERLAGITTIVTGS